MKQAMDSGAWLENRARELARKGFKLLIQGSDQVYLIYAMHFSDVSENEPIPAGKSIAMSFSGFETEDQMQRRIYEVMRKLPVLPKE
jgi:hypothetical protein